MNTRNWPAVPARVVFDDVVEETRDESDGRVTRHTPRVVYEYTVGGRVYRSDVIQQGGLGAGWSERHDADDELDNLTGVVPFVAYVNPVDPAQAVLRHKCYSWPFGR